MQQSASGPYALISVTDKSGIVAFGRSLVELGYQILSTGGTASLLRDEGVPVTEVADFTQSTEFFNGRIKTLHPRIHGGILMDRDAPLHRAEAIQHQISPIDLVVVNLYQFAEKAIAGQLAIDEAIEYIDIGGPTMLRAAAKNHKHCLPVIDPTDYAQLLEELKGGGVQSDTRRYLAAKVFQATARYDLMIASYLCQGLKDNNPASSEEGPKPPPEKMELTLDLRESLRYGENPQQSAGFYTQAGLSSGLQDARILQGKALSYNNYLDLNAAASLVSELNGPAMAIIKHTNPCGVAQGHADEPLAAIYERALAGDPKSAFGGIVASNQEIDGETATELAKIFLECIAAPSFSDEAKEVFDRKKNLRLLELPFLAAPNARPSGDWQIRSVRGGYLVQSADSLHTTSDQWQAATELTADKATLADLYFAWTVAKHVKSNAIVLARDLATVAIGAGQMSRVDAVQIAIQKASEEGKSLDKAVLASDAFFPFRDSIDHIAQYGIRAIVQPGGSLRDDESIEASREHGIAMYLTGRRHFCH